MSGQLFTYRHAPDVVDEVVAGRPTLVNALKGRVAVDERLLALWWAAPGCTPEELARRFWTAELPPVTIRAALACLAEAGLLERDLPAAPREPEQLSGPLVSAVVVSYKSRGWLAECLPSLLAQTYTPLEIVVVDNGCLDDAAEWLAANFPHVRVVRLEQSASFAAANNIGVAAAKGEFFFLVNPDVRLEPDAVAQLVRASQGDPECAAVGAKLKFWWAPAFLNGLGNRVGPFSWGSDNGLGHLDLGQFDHWQELPSACFAAVLIRRSHWEQIGPADTGFPMYYEDAEWSYRARLMGYRVRAAPQAVVYHAFGGRVPGGDDEGLTPRKLRNVVYGRLRFSMKLLDQYRFRFLRNYWMEDWTNFTGCLAKRDWASARAYLNGWADVWRTFPALGEQRRLLQARRALSDEALFALQRDMPGTLVWNGLPELTMDLIHHHYMPLIRAKRTRPMPEFEQLQLRPLLLIVSNDVVDVKMAGPGMRYLEMARALAEDLDVTLAVPAETSLQIPGLRIVRYWEERPESLHVLVENSDVALVSGYMVEKFPFLAVTHTRLVVDMYDPFVLENLHYYLQEPIEAQEHLNDQAIHITNRLAGLGDFFICGNDRQRDYWMGVLTANRRANPRNFSKDPTLRALIDIVGIGFPDREPQARPILRGIHPQVPPEARIVLWGGGIWNWLDPLTLVKAWPQVLAAHPEARLVFLGTRHPNPLVPRHEIVARTEALAAETGEKDRTIIFMEWLSYEDREALLCEADVGVVLHPIHVETRYSLRTRVLDYLWARLPVLITDGDVTSEWVHRYGLGEVAPEHDAEAVAQKLVTILDQPKAAYAQAFEPLRATMTWKRAVEPLRLYCLQGGYAPDRLERNVIAAPPLAGGLRGRLARARFIYRTEGPRALLHRGWRYIQWRLSRP